MLCYVGDFEAALPLAERPIELDPQFPEGYHIPGYVHLGMKNYARAVELCDALVSRVFASAAGLFGSAEAPRDPVLVPVLLGLDGRRYLAFRSTVREARTGTVVDAREALGAFAFAIDARIARSAI